MCIYITALTIPFLQDINTAKHKTKQSNNEIFIGGLSVMSSVRL